MLPAGSLIAIWLLLVASRQIALRWAASLLLVGIAVAGLRWLLYICPLPGALALRIPSGHAAGSALVYGGLAFLIARDRSRRKGVTMIAAAAILVAAIAFSRVYLPNGHSAAEVVAGLSIGLCCLAWLARADLKPSAPLAYPEAVTVAVIALAVLLHGNRLGVWSLLRRLALYAQSLLVGAG